MAHSKKLHIGDYQSFKTVTLKSGQTVTHIARDLLPSRLRTRQNVGALAQQILLINRLSEQQARFMAPGRKLTVPDIAAHLGQDRSHIHQTQAGETLRQIINHYYDGQSRSAAIGRLLAHPQNLSLNLENELDQPLAEGLSLHLPSISPSVGESVSVPYNFYRPELWLRRWVSVMRSLKSTVGQFRDVLVQVGPLSRTDIDMLVSRIVSENPDLTNANRKNWPTTRTGHVQLMLDDLRREPFQGTEEDDVKSELTALREKRNAVKKEHQSMSDEINRLRIELENDSNMVESLKHNIQILQKWQDDLKAGKDMGGFEPILAEPNMLTTTLTPVDKDDSGAVQFYVNPLADDAMLDPEFELKQLLNLYTLCWNLLVFVDESLGPKIASSLPGHWRAKNYRKHPPINLVQEALRRASADVEIIQRALVQRRRAHAGGETRLTRQGESLLIMDKLALKSLAPFQHLLLDGDHQINPITYFSENTHIRRVPYVENTLLVGIAYAHASHYQDDVKAYDYLLKNLDGVDSEQYWPSYEVMAIPHEAGHFFYHHAKDPKSGRTLADLTAEAIKNDPYGRWYEEIFADVYGCLISGPLTAMGMQGLLAGSSVRNMSRDDGEHPVPIFRPFILSEILRELSGREELPHGFYESPDALDNNWEKMLRLRGHIPAGTSDLAEVPFAFVQAEGKHHDHFDESRENMMASVKARTLVEATVPQVLAAVRPIIVKFVSFLAENVDFEPWGPYTSDLEYGIEDMTDSPISLNIPWTYEDYADLYQYDMEMHKLTNQAVARNKVPNPTVQHGKKSTSVQHAKAFAAQQMTAERSLDAPEAARSIRFDPDEAEQTLLEYLNRWGDSGPKGWGNHP